MERRSLTIVGRFAHQSAFLFLQRPPVEGEGVLWLKPFSLTPEGQLAHQGRLDMSPGLGAGVQGQDPGMDTGGPGRGAGALPGLRAQLCLIELEVHSLQVSPTL